MVGNFRQSATQIRPITNVKPVISNRPTSVLSGRPVNNLIGRPTVIQVRPVSNPNIPTLPGMSAIQEQGNYQSALDALLQKQNPNYKANVDASKTFWGMLDNEQGRNELLFKVVAILVGVGILFISINGMVK